MLQPECDVFAVLANICCLRAKPEAGAVRWRVRDVIVVSAG